MDQKRFVRAGWLEGLWAGEREPGPERKSEEEGKTASSSFSAVSSAPPPGWAGILLVPTWSSQDCHGTMEKLFQASVQ